MPFRAPGPDEYTGSKFKPAEAEEYRVSVDGYEIVSGKVTQYNPKGNDRVRFYLSPLNIEGDEEADMVDTDGVPLPEDKRFVFFFDPDHLGLKPVVSKSRKFLASALGVPNEQPVEADSLKSLCDSLVGRELIVSVTVKGEYNNIADSRAVRRKERKARVATRDLTAEAEKIFNSEDEEEF